MIDFEVILSDEYSCVYEMTCARTFVRGTQESVTRNLFPVALLCAAWVSAGKPVEIKLKDLTGRKVKLSDYRGKIVVLNFWATWCGPCREEMPLLVETQKAWDAKGIIFIAVSLDDDRTKKDVAAFLNRYHVGFPAWTGGTTEDLDKLKLGQGVPDTVFVDESGQIIARVLGEIKRDELEERLLWLTSDRKSAPPPALVNHM